MDVPSPELSQPRLPKANDVKYMCTVYVYLSTDTVSIQLFKAFASNGKSNDYSCFCWKRYVLSKSGFQSLFIVLIPICHEHHIMPMGTRLASPAPAANPICPTFGSLVRTRFLQPIFLVLPIPFAYDIPQGPPCGTVAGLIEEPALLHGQ